MTLLGCQACNVESQLMFLPLDDFLLSLVFLQAVANAEEARQEEERQ